MKKQKISTNVEIKKLPKSEIEITGSIPADIFTTFRYQAIKNINGSITIDGFRKGNIPEKIIVEKVGEKNILEEMAELSLSEAYPSIMVDRALDPIGRPEIRITKLEKDNPLEFIIKVAVMPSGSDISLANYKKIASDTPATNTTEFTTTEKEISDAIERIKKSYENHEGHDHPHGNIDHSEEIKKLDTLEFKEHISKSLTDNKIREAQEKRRIIIADKISTESKIELPLILIDREVNRTEIQFTEDIKRMGYSLEDYLKQAKKTIEDLRKEWIPYAEKKVKLQIIINKIAEDEKIIADEKEIEKEVSHIMEHYKNADRDQARSYAVGIITNEKVFHFLENQSA